MVLLSTGLRQGFAGHELADLYFRRWPIQENAFQDAVVLGLNLTAETAGAWCRTSPS
jgi:hypothetical protein